MILLLLRCRRISHGPPGSQVMGPDDTYMVQYDADVSHFWADRNELALGACFEPVVRERAATIIPRQIVTEVTCAPGLLGPS